MDVGVIGVGAMGKNGTNGLRDFWRGQTARRHLVKQRLKQMMVGAVNNGDARVGAAEILTERQAAKARA